MSGCDPCGCCGGRGENHLKQMAELSKNLKEGKRLLAPSRRPDGSLRKPIRIRAGYVPQEEVAIYQSKGALWRKEMVASQEVPPGYDPVLDGKTKTKSAKRNERKKEKRLQVELKEGPLTEFTHEMEPFLRKQRLPVRLNKGVVELVSDFIVCDEGKPLSLEASRILRLLGIKMATFRLHLICRWSEDDFELLAKGLDEDSDVEIS